MTRTSKKNYLYSFRFFIRIIIIYLESSKSKLQNKYKKVKKKIPIQIMNVWNSMKDIFQNNM